MVQLIPNRVPHHILKSVYMEERRSNKPELNKLMRIKLDQNFQLGKILGILWLKKKMALDLN